MEHLCLSTFPSPAVTLAAVIYNMITVKVVWHLFLNNCLSSLHFNLFNFKLPPDNIRYFKYSFLIEANTQQNMKYVLFYYLYSWPVFM